MKNMPKETLKIIIFSTLISINITVWHEILGFEFLVIVFIGMLYLIYILERK